MLETEGILQPLALRAPPNPAPLGWNANEIEDCPKLTIVPGCFTSIKTFTVCDVNSILPLTNICRNLTTLTSLSSVEWQSLLTFPDLVSLKDLCIGTCEELTCLPSGLLQSCTSLRTLTISSCSNLIALPELEQVGTSLLYLAVIYDCHKLTCLPSLGCHTRLSHLSLGPFSKELNSLTSLDTLQNMQPRLRRLELYGWSHWESIPEQLQHLTSLTNLAIHGFGIKTLPDWFGNLSCLQTILIWDCEKLEYLPNMESLTKLIFLYSYGWSEIPPRTDFFIDDHVIRHQN